MSPPRPSPVGPSPTSSTSTPASRGSAKPKRTTAPCASSAPAKELLTRALAEAVHSGDYLDSPEKVRDLLRLRFADLAHEVFGVVLLDAQHRVLDVVELFRGTLSQTSVYPREVVKLALEANAAAVILVHNHPSGSLEPSTADIALTDTLKKALALIDVRVLDHFIVAGNTSPLAFSERGLL